MSKTDLHSSLLFLMIKLEEAKNNSMSDKNFVAALTDVLRYFRDNGELKKAYEIQKGSLTNMANSPWAKLVIGMLTSKVQEDKVDVELPDIDALIKENTSDEFIERKINDILGIRDMNNSDNDLEILEEFTYSILKDLKSLEPDISQLVDGYFWHLVVQNLKK